MDDTLLVSRAMAGDLDSFGQLYDRYFPRVYDFTWRVLKDADEAASVTESIFATAMTSLAALPNAASFRSWLFTIAYRAAVTRAAGLGSIAGRPGAVHEEAFGSFDVPDACFVEDPSVAGGDPETAALVWEAATALSPRDYAVLDLHLRQGLDSAEIASVLAMSKSNAYSLINRMTSVASDVMTGYVVARTGNKTCEALQRVLAPFDFPPYTDAVRQAVDEHVGGCETCQATRKAVPAPLTILGAFAAVRPPRALKGDVWRAIAASWHVPRAQTTMMTASDAGVGAGAWIPGALSSGGGIGLTGGGGSGGGAGAMGSPGWDRKRILMFAGAAAGMLLFAFLIGTVLVMAVGGGGGNGGPVVVTTETSTVAPAATVAASETPGVAVVTPTAETPTPAPPTPTPTPAPPTPTSTPATPTATSTPAGVRTATPTPLKTSVLGTATPTAKTTTTVSTATATP